MAKLSTHVLDTHSGRPAAGVRAGEKVSEYPQLTIRLPAETKAKLNALSAITGLAQWRLIAKAVDGYLRQLPAADRQLVANVSHRLLKE